MKHKLLLIAIQLVAFSVVYAQNANGLLFDATNSATRDASAAFEINANTNTVGSPLYGGLLLPRVALTGTTDVTTIAGTEATSLLVYNTATAGDVTPGFYYWESGAWKRIVAGNGNFPTGSGTQNYVTKWNNAAGTTIGNSQIFDNATNVGINSATPAAKLDVVGPATGTGVTIRASGGGDVVLASGGALFFDGNYSYASGNYIRPIGGANTQGFFTLGTERVRITSNGNVGIGTTGPLSSLDVYRATGIGLLDDAIKVHRPGSYGQYAFMAYAQSSSDAYFGSVYTGSPGVYGQMYFRQYTQGGVFRDAMFIKTDGNVGIGNTGPSYKLDVTGDTRTTGDFYGDIHVDDTRLVNDPPTTYNNEVAFDFKARATIGVPGTGTYSGNMTIAPWGDNSGDASHQVNFNEGGLFWRQGQPDAATWDAWSQIVTTAPGGTGTTDYVTKWTSTTNLGTTTDGGIFGTSGNTGTTRTLTILDNGDARINFGSYPGEYSPALQIQNNDNTRFVWLSPLGNASGANARLRVSGSGLDIYAGGGNDAGTYSATFAANGNVGVGITAPNGKLDVTGDIFGVNEYSFQGGTESTKDWENSGLQITPTINSATDDSWYIQSNSSEWSRGLLSRRRFSRTPGLTLEYEAYLQQPIGGNVHYMVGFVDGNTTSYSYCQNPSNLMYHDHAGLNVYENCGSQGSSYSFDTRNAWYKFKVVLKGAGANYYVFHNGSWRLVLSTANNSNKYVRILISAYNNRIHIRNMKVYQSDFNNSDASGVNASAAQYVPSNSGAVEVTMASYPSVSKGGDPTSASNATLVIGSITVSGNDIRFANGIGGLGFPGTNSVQNLAHGVASFTVSLEKRINGGAWTSVYSQSAMCAFAVGDYYMQANGLTNAFGISGDMYRYPNSVSFSYFDTDATVGNYEYRLVFTPGGYNKLNGYNYAITQRNLTALQIKR